MKVKKDNKLNRQLRNLSIKTKLSLFYGFVFAVFFTVFTIYVSLFMQNEIVSKEERELISNSISAASYCNSTISSVENLYKTLSKDEDIVGFLQATDMQENVIDEWVNNTFAEKLTRYKENHINVIIYADKDADVLVTNQASGLKQTKEIYDTAWYKTLSVYKSPFWEYEPQIKEVEVESVGKKEKQDHVFIAYNGFIDKPSVQGETLGVVRIEIDLTEISPLFNMGDRKFYLIFPETDNVMYSNVTEEINKPYKNITSIDKDYVYNNLYVGYGRDRTFLAYSTFETVVMDETWSIAYETLEIDLLSSARQTVVIIVGISISAFVIIFFILLAFTTRMTKRLKQLMNATYEIASGNYDAKIEVDGGDEIGMLAEDFNQMTDKLNELINETYKQRFELQDYEIKQKQAEIETYQNQINPHFLYNTLETIRMHALIYDNEEVADMLVLLAKLFRYNINLGNIHVKIRDELTYLDNYIAMLNLRSQSNINLITDVSDNVLDSGIIKMTLQPLVENVIKHGFKNRSNGNIKIIGRKEKSKVVLVIQDDGTGIDKAKMTEINKDLAKDYVPEDCTSVGLRNVNRRIKLYYGSDYGVKIMPSDNGARIKITLPINVEEQEAEKKGENDA